MIRILRRKFATPLGLLITVVFVWYSVVMLEGMFSPVREQSVDSYDLKIQEAMMEIKDQRNARKTAELLQTPDNENSILERRAEFDTNHENDQVNINNFENLEEIELKEEQNHHQNLVYEADVNEQVNENLNDLEIKDDSNDGDRDEEKEKLQINPPLKDLPKINLPIKEGIGKFQMIRLILIINLLILICKTISIVCFLLKFIVDKKTNLYCFEISKYICF